MTTLRRIAGRLAASIVICLLVPQAVARAGSNDSIPAGKWAALTFDPAQTTIAFTLNGWPHATHGAFELERGTIRVDPVGGKMDGAIVVDAASGISGDDMRDSRMKNGVLEAQRFPQIIFAPQQVESHGNPPGEFPVVVRGLMTLHGAQHPFTIAAKVQRRGEFVTIHSDFVIPYIAWGLENPSVLFFTVAKQVELHVTAVARLSWVSP